MTLIAVVKNGEELINNAEVGVFAGTECRGASTPDEDGIHFLTVAGEGYGTVPRNRSSNSSNSSKDAHLR
ncbi:MAG: hypothetical protein RR371_00305 [Bacteroides sp.]